MITVPRYKKGVAITPSATVNFGSGGGQGELCDAIYVGGAGIVVVVFEDDSAVSFTAVAGQILPLAAKRVNATSSASLMVALYCL